MNFLSNFFDLYNRLQEDDVFFTAMRGLLEHKDEVKNMTIYDMAEVCLVSRTTLNRLSKRLGYGTFKEFKYDMVQSFSKSEIHNHLIPMTHYGAPEETVSRILTAAEETVAGLREHVPVERLMLMAGMLRDADRVRIYTPCLPGANTLQTNLALDGRDVRIVSGYEDQKTDAGNLTAQSIVITTNDTRPDSLDLAPILRSARERGARFFFLGSDTRYAAQEDMTLPCMFVGGSISQYGVSLALDLLASVYRQRFMMIDLGKKVPDSGT